MTYSVDYNPHLGRYEMVIFTQLEGNVRLKTEFRPLNSTTYTDAVAEAERIELMEGAPFVMDLNDIEVEAMADYYAAGSESCEFDR